MSVDAAQDPAGSYRVSVTGPQRRDVCVLVQSGQMNRFDDPGPEARLRAALIDDLGRAGVAVVQFDMPARDDPERPATEAHVAARTRRLRDVLAHLGEGEHRIGVLGFSLGARSLLEVLVTPATARIHAAVLVGFVIDEPTVVMAAIDAVHLVYGGRDYIADLDAQGQPIRVLAPEEYAEPSLQRLVLRPRQRRACTVLAGLGHLLTGDDPAAAASALAGFVVDALSPPPPRRVP